MYNVNHDKSFGLVLIAVNEVPKHIVYTGLYHIFLIHMVIKYIVAFVSLMHLSNDKAFCGYISPLLLVHIVHKYIRTL